MDFLNRDRAKRVFQPAVNPTAATSPLDRDRIDRDDIEEINNVSERSF